MEPMGKGLHAGFYYPSTWVFGEKNSFFSVVNQGFLLKGRVYTSIPGSTSRDILTGQNNRVSY